MTELRAIGKRIKKLIMTNGRTMEDFCFQFGYNIHDIGRLCDGRLIFTIEQYQKLANDCGANIDDIFNDNYISLTRDSEDKILDLFEMYIILDESAYQNPNTKRG